MWLLKSAISRSSTSFLGFAPTVMVPFAGRVTVMDVSDSMATPTVPRLFCNAIFPS